MLDVTQLTRRFGDLVAVDELSFSVPAGQITGFIGGNGAGKTTTMRMIMGLLRPDSGQISWQGEPITNAVRQTFGYMPEERGLYPKEPVLPQLVYLARLRGAGRKAAEDEASTLLETFGLADRGTQLLEKLSLGNQQRVQIAASVMHHPQALILDEPFSGLDPEAVDSLAGLLAQHTASGTPLLFSSHQLDLVERLCDSLVILSHGQVVASGTRDDLASRAESHYRLVTGGDPQWIRGARGVEILEISGHTAMLRFDSGQARTQLMASVLERDELIELARVQPSLAEIYREVTK
jgi:ABC-2 type transport system ATP-binding protein